MELRADSSSSCLGLPRAASSCLELCLAPAPWSSARTSSTTVAPKQRTRSEGHARLHQCQSQSQTLHLGCRGTLPAAAQHGKSQALRLPVLLPSSSSSSFHLPTSVSIGTPLPVLILACDSPQIGRSSREGPPPEPRICLWQGRRKGEGRRTKEGVNYP